MSREIIIEFIILIFFTMLILKYKACVLKDKDLQDVKGLALWILSILGAIVTILVEKYVMEDTAFFYNLIKSLFQ